MAIPPHDDVTASPDNPEQLLALSYAPAPARLAMRALFALDARLGHILRSTREPMVGQMRLTWWHGALSQLDTQPAPAEPILAAIAKHILPRGVTGAQLADMVDGWEILLDAGASDVTTLEQHAAQRGIGLFAAAAAVLGAPPGDPVAPAGRGWALADLARNLSDGAVAHRALALAAGPLASATSARWSRAGRSLGALAHIARMNTAVPLDQPIPIGSPGRVWRLLRHRITGN